VVLGALLSGCNVTRHIPSDAYLLQRVKIEEDKSTPRAERVKSDEVTKYLRQKPNKHFLGTDFYAWIYMMAKPDKEIYEYLLSTYNLVPEECIFIDDNPANIAMAKSLGIHGYLFDFDVPKLREYLKKENLI
jgi:ribonucleotide monophosphatase NagD (HAD superfamily)